MSAPTVTHETNLQTIRKGDLLSVKLSTCMVYRID